MAFGLDGRVVAAAQEPFEQIYPQAGWVEQNASVLAGAQLATLGQVVSQLEAGGHRALALGITNQRETVVVWDRRTGEPIHHAIVWQDRRTADELARHTTDSSVVELVRDRTGLVLDPYFSASKIQWILCHVDGARRAAEEGHLAFGTVESWLVWCLTEGRVHITDASNAARTMLFDIRRQCWDDDLLDLFQVPRSMLPEVVDCAGRFGSAVVAGGIPICGMIGDQQSALFGQGCMTKGDVKTTYGTGCFLLMNTAAEVVTSASGLLSTVAWRLKGAPTWALEGSVFMGGASIQWLRDGLGIIDSAADVNELAASVPDTDGVVRVPAFAGLGAPHWDAWGRAAILGMTRGTTAAHIARATLEGVALSVGDVLHAMEKDADTSLHELRVDGGAAASDLLMQIQADVLGSAVLRPAMLETTAWGAAAMAGLGVGCYESTGDASARWHLDRRFEPTVASDRRQRKLRTWARAVSRVRGWAKNDDAD